MTEVVNIRTRKYDIYIGRGTQWGNPFHIGKNGTREAVIKKYETYARNSSIIMNNLHLLKDKVLGCHCKPLACHGDVLVKLVNEKYKE